MRYLPIFFDVRWRRCLVVGGGGVAVQKINALLNAGARVTVVSPELDPSLSRWTSYRLIDVVPRQYQSEDLEGCCLVVAATNDQRIQEQVAEDARSRGIPCNVVDRPELCTFVFPAVFASGDLTVAVSTNGHCPGFARLLRDRLSELLGPEYPIALRLFAALRNRWLAEGVPVRERNRRFDALFHGPLLAAIRAKDWGAVEASVTQVTGAITSLQSLGLADLPIQHSSMVPPVVSQCSQR